MHLSMLLLLILLALGAWFAIPLLNGIVDKASLTRDVRLPEMNRGRHNSQRVDRLHAFIDTLYWTDQPQVARTTRLQAEVLIHGFEFEPEPYLAKEANKILADIRKMNTQRKALYTNLRQLGPLLLKLAGNQARIATLTDTPPAKLQQRLTDLLQTLSAGTGNTTDWHSLSQQLSQLRDALTPWAHSGSPALVAQSAQLSLLQQRLDRISDLAQQSRQLYEHALQLQHRLTSMLNSDAELKTQKLANALVSDAVRVRHYTLLLLSSIALLCCIGLFSFNTLVVRPILRCTHWLTQMNRGEELTDRDADTLFEELNSVSRAVQHYGETTTQLRQANEELQRLSDLDGLTGLANRRHFDAVLSNELARAARHNHSLSLILFDLDYFKKINDEYGHLFGDDCLCAFAGLLRHYSQRAGELAARYGGEEFVLILPELTLQQTETVAEQIRKSSEELELRPADDGSPVRISVSGGLLHTVQPHKYTPERLLQQTDEALYRAKQQGRNRIDVVTDEQNRDDKKHCSSL